MAIAQQASGWQTVKSRAHFLKTAKAGDKIKIQWPISAIMGDGESNMHWKEGELNRDRTQVIFPDGGRVDLPPRDFMVNKGEHS